MIKIVCVGKCVKECALKNCVRLKVNIVKSANLAQLEQFDFGNLRFLNNFE